MKTSTTAQRLKQIMDIRGLKQVDLFDLCFPVAQRYGIKINRSNISQYVNGIVEPNQDKLVVLSEALHVSPAWLMGYDEQGTSEAKSNLVQLPKKPTLPAADQSLLDKYHILDTHGKAVVDTVLTAEYSRCVALEYETTPVRRYANPSAAGEPLWAEGEYEMVDYEKRLVPKGTDYAVGISGHSMEPTLMDGSTVFVRKSQDIVDGDVIIAWIEGEGTVCKRALVENGKLVRLTSDNPDYGGIEGERLNNMRVYGKVIGYTVKVK